MGFLPDLRFNFRGVYADVSFALSVIDRCDISVSDVVLDALILAEDRRYYFHFGVDPVAIARALWLRLSAGRLQGASTLEAQLIRTISERREISFRRKIRECLCATIISLLRPKKKIALAYLNCAYFGYPVHGIRHCALKYGWKIDDFSLEEVCVLISLIRRPMRKEYDGPRRALVDARSRWLIDRLSVKSGAKPLDI